MFSRLKSLRALIESATLGGLPDGVSMDPSQEQAALGLIRQLSDLIRGIKIESSTTTQEVAASVSSIEDTFFKLANVMNRDSYVMIKNAETDKREILRLLTDAHKNFVEKPSVRSLAMSFAKDELGQFPDIGQALSKMIDAHNYVTPRIEEVMSNISVQIGVEGNSNADVEPPVEREGVPPEVPETPADEPGIDSREIEVKMPEEHLPRIDQR